MSPINFSQYAQQKRERDAMRRLAQSAVYAGDDSDDDDWSGWSVGIMLAGCVVVVLAVWFM